ncbi:MAG: hypothetical protein GY722_18055 [bacterium]|nr:hypothetical protein [bacterium]
MKTQSPPLLDFHGIISVILVFILSTSGAGAITFVVTKEADENGVCDVDDCALREAIIAANTSPGRDEVILPAGNYQLSILGPPENQSIAGDLDVRDDLDLLGSGGDVTFVLGDGSDRVLHIRSSTVTISGITIIGGSVVASGGGIRASLSDITVDASTVMGNSTIGDGGGIFLDASTMFLVDSNISGNTAGADGFGGGIHVRGIGNAPGELAVVNSTISDNKSFFGGGIAGLSNVHIIFTNSTFVGNTATFLGDAFANRYSPPPTFVNTLIVGDCAIFSNIPVSHGGNIESPGHSCFLQHSTDRADIADPGIAPLSDNGGPTLTHALLPGSPAIDTAIDGRCPSTDQRGLGRPVDGDGDRIATCDVGAFELHPEPLTIGIPTLDPAGFAGFAMLLVAVALLAIRRAQSEGRRRRCLTSPSAATPAAGPAAPPPDTPGSAAGRP